MENNDLRYSLCAYQLVGGGGTETTSINPSKETDSTIGHNEKDPVVITPHFEVTDDIDFHDIFTDPSTSTTQSSTTNVDTSTTATITTTDTTPSTNTPTTTTTSTPTTSTKTTTTTTTTPPTTTTPSSTTTTTTTQPTTKATIKPILPPLVTVKPREPEAPRTEQPTEPPPPTTTIPPKVKPTSLPGILNMSVSGDVLFDVHTSSVVPAATPPDERDVFLKELIDENVDLVNVAKSSKTSMPKVDDTLSDTDQYTQYYDYFDDQIERETPTVDWKSIYPPSVNPYDEYGRLRPEHDIFDCWVDHNRTCPPGTRGYVKRCSYRSRPHEIKFKENCHQVYYDEIKEQIRKQEPALRIAETIVSNIQNRTENPSGGDIPAFIRVTEQLHELFDNESKRESEPVRQEDARQLSKKVCK